MSTRSIFNRRLLAASITIISVAGAAGTHAHESSIQPALVRQGGYIDVTVNGHSGLLEVAHYPLIVAMPRAYYNMSTTLPGTGTAWDRIHYYNPDAEIMLYQGGPIARDDSTHEQVSQWLNTVSRWQLAREDAPGIGNLYTDHPSFLLTRSGSPISVDPSYAWQSYWLKFGDTGVQSYWADATINDLYKKIYPWSNSLDTAATNSLRPWTADGLFVDVASAVPNDQVSTNDSYSSPGSWQTNMAAFTAAATANIRAYDSNQRMYFNVTFSQTPEGKGYWATLDQLSAASRPDGALEEGAFATSWTAAGVDTSFYAEDAWKRQLDTLAGTQNMNAIFESHTKTAPGSTGTDNWGHSTSFWDTVWFSMSSYLLGKNEVQNNSYFNFWRASDFSYLDEYDLDIGKAVATYQKDSTKSVYLREYDKAWVLVNPSNTSYSAYSLPEPGKLFDHDNFQSPATLPNSTTATLAPHRGLVVLKDPMIGQWKLDESTGSSVADAHEFLLGNTLGGTAYGSPTWLPSGGLVGGALQFDGVDDYVAVAHDTAQLVTPKTLSISYWVKPDSGTTGSNKATVMQFGTWQQSGWQLWSGTGWREFSFTVFGGTPSVQSFSKPYQAPMSSTEWTHLAVTVENKAGGSVDMYMNGQPFYHDTLATPFVSTSSDVLYLGAHAGGTGAATYWAGKLDNVKIQRKIMSPYEVNAEYLSLIGDWRLDEPKYRFKAFDSFGSMHGRVGDGATWLGAGGSGAPAGAIEFDGVDGEIVFDHNTAQLDTSQQFTINAWIDPATSTNPGVLQYTAPDGSLWILYATPDDHTVGIAMYDGTSLDYFAPSAPTPLALSSGSWNKVTLSVDNKNGGTVKLYVNDVAVPVESAVTSATTLDRHYTLPAGGTLRFGNTDYGYWTGKLGHVEVFSRILSQAEITQLTQ